MAINVAFFISCNEEPEDRTNAIGLRGGGFPKLIDSNTACFLNIGYYRADVTEDGTRKFATTIDAYCSDGDTKNPKFVNRKYIRCNGEDMKIWYNDPLNVGRYGWSKETINEPLNQLKIEMNPKITIIESALTNISPIIVDPEKGFEIHYTGGGYGTEAYMSVGFTGNGVGKWFTDNGSGVIKFTPEEVKQFSVLFLEGEELEKYEDSFEEKWGYRPNGEYGFTITTYRNITTKTEFKNGKNLVANISQADPEGIALKLKK